MNDKPITNEFSPLEVQLIRSSLINKTDEEIAELLDRPADEVRIKIDELTGGGSTSRITEVIEWRKQQEEKKTKTGRPVTLNEKKPRPAAVKKERVLVEQQYEKKEKRKTRNIEYEEKLRRKELEGRQINRKYKTLVIDYSKMKSVRVNRSTHIWVDKNMPDDEAIKKYQQNLEHYNRKNIASH